MLLRSFEKIEAQNLGMQTGGVLAVKAALPWFRYNTNQKSMDFYLRLESAIRRLPGTRAVGMADSIPPGGWQGEFRYADLVVQGKPRPIPGTGGTIVSREVTPDYFRALNIPIVHGRSFAEQDRTGDQREAVISRLLATQMFPDENPIGKRIQTVGLYGDAWFSVVGVADNVKNTGLTERSAREIYFLRRSVSDDWNGNRVIIFVDSVMPPASIEQWVRSEIASIDRTVPVDMVPLDHTISQLADRPRFETALLAFFAFTGLALAVVGLYGLLAFITTQRTHEIGVWMALGATKGNVFRLITGDGLRMVIIGGFLGLGLAIAVSRMLSTLLYQVSTYDPVTYIVVPIFLSLVALIAILIPARRGMRVILPPPYVRNDRWRADNIWVDKMKSMSISGYRAYRSSSRAMRVFSLRFVALHSCESNVVFNHPILVRLERLCSVDCRGHGALPRKTNPPAHQG